MFFDCHHSPSKRMWSSSRPRELYQLGIKAIVPSNHFTKKRKPNTCKHIIKAWKNYLRCMEKLKEIRSLILDQMKTIKKMQVICQALRLAMNKIKSYHFDFSRLEQTTILNWGWRNFCYAQKLTTSTFTWLHSFNARNWCIICEVSWEDPIHVL